MDWLRLEGGTVDPDLTEGMSAAVADPLWALGRQWQVGEFRGEDAASPVMLAATVVGGLLTDYWVDGPDGRTMVAWGETPWPLEALVEHEPIAAGPAGVRRRLDAGAWLVRELRLVGEGDGPIAVLHEAFGVLDDVADPLDPLGSALLALLAGRVPDSARVVAALDAVGGDPSAVPELAALSEPGQRAVAAWYGHQADLFCEVRPDQQPAWDPTRLEYRFGVNVKLGTEQVSLEAREYPGGTLDWHHFDVVRSVEGAGAGPGDGRFEKRLRSLPVPVRYAGMPASRWWELEDGDVDFGDLGGGPEDLARSVLAAFAMVAGDDWFRVPCQLPAGSLSRVKQVTVLDDFGDVTPVRATAVVDDAGPGERVWRAFELHGDPGPAAGRAPLLFLPPVVHSTEEGHVLEHVEFRRDEMANLAWAIERRVESRAGRTVDRLAPRTPPAVEPDHDDNPDRWRYRLSTDVPDHWVPLVPVRINGNRPQIALRRGRFALDGEEQRAKGRILEPERSFVLHEEEVPTGGVQVERRWELARGGDGRVRVWVGRRKSPGGGPMARTPLRFDQLAGVPRRPAR